MPGAPATTRLLLNSYFSSILALGWLGDNETYIITGKRAIQASDLLQSPVGDVQSSIY